MSKLHSLLSCFCGCILFFFVGSLLDKTPSLAASQIVVRYGLLEESLPVSDIRKFAETKQVSSDLQFFFNFLDSQAKQKLQDSLQVKMSLNVAALNKVLDTPLAKQALSVVSKSIARRDNAGTQALRAAIILGAKSKDGLGVVSFLEAYPSDRLVIDVPKALEIVDLAAKYSGSDNAPGQDKLSSSSIWQVSVKYQTFASQNKQFSSCLFGDSITAELGNSLGEGNFNFALNGLSAISLSDQLKLLAQNKVKCQTAVIAVGGNDAWYGISDEVFASKLRESIAMVRQMGTKDIYLIPGFYSTVAASSNPNLSAPNSRVEQINTIINRVASEENIKVEAEGLQPLYDKNALKEEYTTDGDHLNSEGLKIYRQALLKILN